MDKDFIFDNSLVMAQSLFDELVGWLEVFLDVLTWQVVHLDNFVLKRRISREICEDLAKIAFDDSDNMCDSVFLEVFYE